MKTKRGAAGLLGLAMLLCTASIVSSQSQPEVRRARPVDESPVPRALPADDSVERVLRSLKDKENSSEPSQHEGEAAAEQPGERQLETAIDPSAPGVQDGRASAQPRGDEPLALGFAPGPERGGIHGVYA